MTSPVGTDAHGAEAWSIAGAHELVWVEGPDAVSFLDGLLSQDIAAIPPGGVRRSLLLAPQGKLRATMWVLRGDDRIGLVTDAGRGSVVIADLTRFKLRVDATISAPPEAGADVVGLAAGEALTAAGLTVPDPEEWSVFPDGVVAAIDHPGWVGRRFFVSAPLDPPIPPLPAGEAEALRVEAGEPIMGLDIDESTIPQEAGVVSSGVDFTKGCYLGQELVARIDARGRVNRHLRILEIDGDTVPPRGARIIGKGRELGSLSSVAHRGRGAIGLSLVRREAEPGDIVDIEWDTGSARGTLREAPAS